MKIFIIFVLALVSKLALVESLRNATAVSDPLKDPHPYVSQIRSIQGTDVRNSNGAIINNRYIICVAGSVYPLPARTFVYLGNTTYNGWNVIRSIIAIRTDREISLLQTNETIPFGDRIKAAPAPVLGQNYGNLMATVTGYGPYAAITYRNFSAIRRETMVQIGYVVNHNTTVTVDQMPLYRNASIVCIDRWDWGSPVHSVLNATGALVGLVLRDLMSQDCDASPSNPIALAARMTKYVPWVRTITTWV